MNFRDSEETSNYSTTTISSSIVRSKSVCVFILLYVSIGVRFYWGTHEFPVKFLDFRVSSRFRSFVCLFFTFPLIGVTFIVTTIVWTLRSSTDLCFFFPRI